jgi:broad specificity phosphatase PhoE
MMKTIWLIRHGQSRSQVDDQESPVDPPLTELGLVQAKSLSDRLAAVDVDVIIVSPLQRTRDTYRCSGLRAPQVRMDKRLLESDWGDPEFYAGHEFYTGDECGAPDPTDAHLEPCFQRAVSLLNSIETAPQASFALFGHWGIFQNLLKAFLELSETANVSAPMDNAAVSNLYISERGDRGIYRWNSTESSQ